MPGVFPISDNLESINAKAKELGGFSLIIVDTSAAYFEGDQENDNTQVGNHARMLRSLTQITGTPCVVANCHPTKNANADSLIPRGGGAFLAEIDGNLTAHKTDDVVTLHHLGKFRGPDFSPVTFELREYRSPNLVNSKDVQIPTVVARWISDTEAREKVTIADYDARRLLCAMIDNPDASVAELAQKLGWFIKKGNHSGLPYKSKVSRLQKTLSKEKLIEKELGIWRVTEKGEKAAKASKTAEAKKATDP